jgi:methylmalonyl-CoA mutase N-terminal domain/subunit
MEETGVTNVADPLGGAWYVEALTDQIEAEAEAIFERIRSMAGEPPHRIGRLTAGILRGIEDGWFMAEIAEAAFTYQQALEKGDKRIVGVNCHTATVAKELEILRISHQVEVEQKRVLAARRQTRDRAVVDAALARMAELARTGENLVPAMLDAARAEATLGEICGALKSEWGSYREPARF